MELYLQFGYGMMEHCRSLLSDWNGGTAILSPRDLNDRQLRRLASDITKLPNGKILLDPQFYLPHADHERLRSHAYWPDSYDTGAFWQGAALTNLLSDLVHLNHDLGSSSFILPGLLATSIDDDWLTIQEQIFEEALSLEQAKPLIATIALSSDALNDQEQVARLIERSEHWQVYGYYLVCEHPGGRYLTDDPNWLANVIDLAAALRMRGAHVICGYSNHQMLIAACAKVSAIASGTWMNVRSFPPEKFRSTYDEEIKQRATWYYCPQTLSEYKVPFLDIAYRQGLLDQLSPAGLQSLHTAALFSGAQPSSVGLTEQAAFRHYLHCLKVQCSAATGNTFDETVRHHETVLSKAELILNQLAAAGIRGQLRDFSEILDVNRAALKVFTTTRGPMLRRLWSTL